MKNKFKEKLEPLTDMEKQYVLCAGLHHRAVYDVLKSINAGGHYRYLSDVVDLGAVYLGIRQTLSKPGAEGFVDEVVSRAKAFIAQLGSDDYDKDEKEEALLSVEEFIREQAKKKSQYSGSLAQEMCPRLVVELDLDRLARQGNAPTVADLREIADKADAAGQVAADVQFLSAGMESFKKWRTARLGKPLGGLATGDQRWDKALDGLKGINILAGNEGCGKTSHALQIMRGVLAHQDDTVAVVVSADMQQEVLIARLVCALGNIPWSVFTKGSGPSGKKKHPFNTKSEHERILAAEAALEELGKDRLVVVGSEGGESVTASALSRMAEQAKCKSGKPRCLLVVDYLQLLSAPGLEGLDADRFRVDELKRVVSAGRKSGDDFAAVIAISEMRKRLAGAKQSAQDGSDIMGSTRIKYAAEATVLTSIASDEEVAGLYPSIRALKGVALKKAVEQKRKELRKDGRNIVSVGLDKGRDGTERGTWLETFHFNTYRFEECVAEVEIPSPPEGKGKSSKKVKK